MMGRACQCQVGRVFKNRQVLDAFLERPLRAPDDSWTRTRTFRAETPVAPFPVEPLEPAEKPLSSTQDGLSRRRLACFPLRDRFERGAA